MSNIGHVPQFEATEKTNKLLTKFLTSLPN